MKKIRYFVCHRFRADLDQEFIKKFYENQEYFHLYKDKEDAFIELKTGFFDDSSYHVVQVTTIGQNDPEFKILFSH